MISIVLADDHQVVRDGVQALFAAEPDFKLLGEAADGLEALEKVGDLKPSVLVVDLIMPKLNGLDVVRQVAKAHSQTRCLVLSMHGTAAYVVEAFRAGAMGYVPKSAPGDVLVQGVRAVAANTRFLGPPLKREDVSAYAARLEKTKGDPYDALSHREREVLHLSAEGHSSNEIAARLRLSHRTVESHRARGMGKLGLRTKTDLIRFALRKGIISVDD